MDKLLCVLCEKDSLSSMEIFVDVIERTLIQNFDITCLGKNNKRMWCNADAWDECSEL